MAPRVVRGSQRNSGEIPPSSIDHVEPFRNARTPVHERGSQRQRVVQRAARASNADPRPAETPSGRHRVRQQTDVCPADVFAQRLLGRNFACLALRRAEPAADYLGLSERFRFAEGQSRHVELYLVCGREGFR